jgi:hypothetical protein
MTLWTAGRLGNVNGLKQTPPLQVLKVKAPEVLADCLPACLPALLSPALSPSGLAQAPVSEI